MDRLSKDEVLHVAELGRLKLSDEEIEKFSYQLKALFSEIEKVNEIDLEVSDGMIAPSTNNCVLREDEVITCSNTKELIENAPCKFDNFIEVGGVLDE